MNNVSDDVGRIQQENITAAEVADIKVGEKLARHREKPWAKRLDAIGKLGDQEPLYAMGFATLAIGLVLRDPKLRLAGVSIVAHVAAADLAKQAVKGMVKRTRPHKLLEEGHYEAEVGEAVDEKPYQSFPSGHVACTLAAAQALGRSFTWPSFTSMSIGEGRTSIRSSRVNLPFGKRKRHGRNWRHCFGPHGERSALAYGHPRGIFDWRNGECFRRRIA